MLITSLIIIFSLGAFASHDLHARHNRHRARHIEQLHRRATTYALTDMYKGESFFSEWDFFTGPDPTNGVVTFLDSEAAAAAKLAYVDNNGMTILAVDNTNSLAPGQNRDSVRITSQKSYNGGLFIVDLVKMPHGCAVWPAFWTVGPNWPFAGEIDVVEGVNLGTTNQYTLHTSAGCTLSTSSGNSQLLFTGQVINSQCASSGADNSGCAFQDSDPSSYGEAFNNAGGGVFAHTWDEAGITIWFFSRSAIPADITAGKPDPSTWPTPSAYFSATTCDMSSHFYEHQIVFDITLCGDWAGATYGSSGCPGTCADAVSDPANFNNAQFQINYVAVYTADNSSTNNAAVQLSNSAFNISA